MSSKRVALLWGEEAYIIEKRIRDITQEQAGAGEEPECLFLDGEQLDRTQLLEALEFVPLFAHNRVIVIRRPRWFGQPGTREAQGLAEVQEVILKYLENPNPFQVLLMTASTITPGNPLVKALKKLGVVEEFKRPDTRTLITWITDECKKRGLQVENQVIGWMAATGQDMFYLENQIEKLSLCFYRRKVTLAEAEEMVENRLEAKIFKLTDALLKRDMKVAYQALQSLLIQGEAPVLVVYMITRQFLTMAKVKGLVERGCSPEEIGSRCGIKKDFVVRKMTGAAAGFSWDEIETIFNQLLEADSALKSGQDGKLVLEVLVVGICSRELKNLA